MCYANINNYLLKNNKNRMNFNNYYLLGKM